jgi:orotidine-5'-phosphate decarboxylase
MQNLIFVAIDTPDLDRARRLAAGLREVVGGIKLGLEFFVANGPDGVRAVVAEAGLPLFLDLKLHDIPNTVAGAVRSACRLGPAMLTIHAAGGPAMLRAAQDAVAEATPAGQTPTALLGVTVLTSLADDDLRTVGQAAPATDQVQRLAAVARDAGLPGIVCSAHEIGALRRAFGRDLRLVVPGLRPAGGAAGDQARVMTPAAALAAGADVLVIGRPITAAQDPAAAARAIAATLAPCTAEAT